MLVVSSHGERLQGLVNVFSAEKIFVVTGAAGSEKDAVTLALRDQPDVVLYDFESGQKKFEIVKKIKKVCLYTRVIVIAGLKDSRLLWAAILSGADGCLPRNMLPSQLVKAVELVCRAGVFCLPRSLRFLLEENRAVSAADGMQEFGDNGEESAKNGISLTSREKEVYRLIASSCSNKEIATSLFISEATVKSHVSSIFRKLGITRRTEVVVREVRRGA